MSKIKPYLMQSHVGKSCERSHYENVPTFLFCSPAQKEKGSVRTWQRFSLLVYGQFQRMRQFSFFMFYQVHLEKLSCLLFSHAGLPYEEAIELFNIVRVTLRFYHWIVQSHSAHLHRKPVNPE